MLARFPRVLAAAAGLIVLVCGCSDPAPDAPNAGVTPVSLGPIGAIYFHHSPTAFEVPPDAYRGAALVDFDGDGALDITLAGRAGVILLRGTGDGRFSRLEGAPEGPNEANGLAWADVDADGDLDLVVTTRDGKDQLWRQRDNGGAFDVSELPIDTAAEGATLGDLDGDGDLDLIIAQGAVTQNGVLGSNGAPNVAYRNDGTGSFEDATATWNLGGVAGGETFAGVLLDIDDDGDMDVLYIHDNANDQLLENPGDGTAFLDTSSTWLPDDPTSIMGVALGDYDGDGRLDLYGTTASNDRLYVRGPDNELVNRYADAVGTGVDQSVAQVGWGVAMADFDHNGRLDVLTTSSYASGSEYPGGPDGPGTLVLLRQTSGGGELGKLVDVSGQAGEVFERSLDGWGLAVGDVDGDGDLDVLLAASTDLGGGTVPAGDDPLRGPALLLNTTREASEQRSLQLTLDAPDSTDRYAVGALVTIEGAGSAPTRVQLVSAGTSYLSQHARALHFGMGLETATRVVKVRWPDGAEQIFGALPPGRHTLTRNPYQRCCIYGSECVPLDEPACRAALAAASGLGPQCASACAKLEECDALAESGFENPQNCPGQCTADPPSDADLACVAQATCAALGDCFTE